MAVLWTILVAVVVFGVVVLVHEAGHYLAARRCGIHIIEFSIGVGPALWTREKNGTRYSVRLLPFGGYNMMAGADTEEEGDTTAPKQQPDAVLALPVSGKTFSEAGAWQRFFVMISGALMNFLLGFLALIVLLTSQDGLTTKRIYDFSEGAATQASGLQPEDEILAVNGHYCFVVEDVFYELQRTENYTASLTVRRGADILTLPAVQFDTTTNEDGTTVMVVDFRVYGLSRSPQHVVMQSGKYFVYYARAIVRSFMDLFSGRVDINQLSGPVGVVSAVSEAVSYGWRNVLQLMILLTINLGVFNLLPIPGLDGFKLIFLAVEGVSGKTVPQRIQAVINAAGIVCLLGLMMLVTMQDIRRFF